MTYRTKPSYTWQAIRLARKADKLERLGRPNVLMRAHVKNCLARAWAQMIKGDTE